MLPRRPRESDDNANNVEIYREINFVMIFMGGVGGGGIAGADALRPIRVNQLVLAACFKYRLQQSLVITY